MKTFLFHFLVTDDETVDSVVFRCKVFLSRMRKEVVLNSRRQGRRLLLEGNSILHSAADSVTSAVQKASQALNERGERLSRAEEKTGEMKNSAEQFSVTAHKVTHTHTCHISDHYKGLGNFSSPHELNRSNVGPTVGIRYNIAKT
uniref:Syntaxin binding protein 6 (amisyn) n=1 Tax=Oncorhynchus tshawytscha TaxID=74940 RepID=A0AAZ3SDE5_ONCTS